MLDYSKLIIDKPLFWLDKYNIVLLLHNTNAVCFKVD